MTASTIYPHQLLVALFSRQISRRPRTQEVIQGSVFRIWSTSILGDEFLLIFDWSCSCIIRLAIGLAIVIPLVSTLPGLHIDFDAMWLNGGSLLLWNHRLLRLSVAQFALEMPKWGYFFLRVPTQHWTHHLALRLLIFSNDWWKVFICCVYYEFGFHVVPLHALRWWPATQCSTAFLADQSLSLWLRRDTGL